MGAMDGEKKVVLRVREFDMERDLAAAEELDRRCQVGLCGDTEADTNSGGNKRMKKNNKKKKSGMSLCVEQVGDPLARVRHAPEHVMLVAEYGEEEKMVGVIKACVKVVSRGGGKKPPSSSSSSGKQQPSSPPPAYVKVACLLGLRVSPSHRRLGIATALVKRAEEWCRARGAEHATMATTASNAASLALFTGRFGYAPFRRPEFLGRPVHAHRLAVPRGHRVFQLPPPLAAAAYARLLPPQGTEFLPADMPALLAHKLTLGTFVAIESDPDPSLPPSFAVLSVWDSTRSLRLRVRGAPALLRASLAVLRALDRSAPWMRVPSIPDIFRPFGAYLLYGLRLSGPAGPALLRSLCHHAHNVARNNPACAVVAADVAPDDPAAAAVPRWRRFSCDEDVWCIKNLNNKDTNASDDDDWAAPAPPGTLLFVDPREF
ncbi:acetyl transferase GW6a-like [Phragmites australis]|uniref:acetyl transferase GW6a-like n=1 Tax=Phragmites australis TaxID=29695 RepID=UPI002D799DD4|nr:acetyl transferase GW6a-like [Phragmites australis]